jgi:preprotein translocase SecE subunit
LARDRKRSKQRRARQRQAAARRSYGAFAEGATARAAQPEPEPERAFAQEPEEVVERDTDGAGEAGDDAELLTRSGELLVPPPYAADEAEPALRPVEAPPEEGVEVFDDELGDADDIEAEGGQEAAIALRPSVRATQVARPRPGAPTTGNRVVSFLQASWAELQRVQWPDRRQVAQATAVVMGFVIIAGAFLGLADLVAQKIVNAIL